MNLVLRLLLVLAASCALPAASMHAAETASGRFGASANEEHTYFVGELGAWVHNGCDTTRPLTPADLGVPENSTVHGTVSQRGGKVTVKVDYLGKPDGVKTGVGNLYDARRSLVGMAKEAGAEVLRIETSPLIEASGLLRRGMKRAGFGERPNGTMFWEGGVE